MGLFSASSFAPGNVYRVFTGARQEGFVFQPISVGADGMTGYMDESASWPRTVQFAEIVHVEVNPARPDAAYWQERLDSANAQRGRMVPGSDGWYEQVAYCDSLERLLRSVQS